MSYVSNREIAAMSAEARKQGYSNFRRTTSIKAEKS